MVKDEKWTEIFGIPPRKPETELTQEYCDLALAIQKVTEDIMLKMCSYARKITDEKHLALAGGVALNCVANGKILRSGLFGDIWIQPAAGDAGGTLGAAYAAWHIYLNRERHTNGGSDKMKGSCLGPAFCDDDIEKVLRKFNAHCV